MKHTLFNHIPLDKIPPFTLRKAGLLAGGLLSVSLCVTDIREKVGNILFGGNPQSESVIVTPNKTTEAVERTVAEGNESPEYQVLKAYNIKKGDTLSHIAREHGVTLESILNVNPKITSPNAISIGEIIIIPYAKTKNIPLKKLQTSGAPQQLAKHTPERIQRVSSEKITNDTTDMRGLTMIFEGFSPRIKVDTQIKGKTTYAIGYGTNVGTLQTRYPFASYGKEVADYLKRKGHSDDSIKKIMHGEESISPDEGADLFEMRYVPRYQKIRAHCGKDWSKYPPVIRNMLVDMSYNIGEYGIFPKGNLPGFPDAVNALNRGDWAKFINEIADSKYASDVGRRAGKWIDMIVRGVLKGKTTGLSPKAHMLLSNYNKKYSKDLNAQIAKKS